MNIVINCRVLNKRHGGPKRVLVNLLKELSIIDTKNNYFLLLDKNYNFDFRLGKNFKPVLLRTGSRIIFEYLYLPIYSYKKKIDVYFMSDPFFSPFIKASKKIIFFHDIIYFEKKIKRESKFFDHLHHKIMIKVSKNFSNKNICISKFTEKRVNELLGIKNTQVVYLGVEDNFKVIKEENILNKIINKYNLKKPFIFYIGSLSPRKNLVRIIKAFNTIKEKIPHNLYLFGGYSWRDKEVINLLNKTNSDNRIIRGGFVEEKDLPLIYNLADLYLYPSLYEGFGLPILEAQACGCPVLTSNVASCPEVAGKGARIVNPYLVEEISEGIMKILNDKKYKEELIKNGFKNVKRFSWEKSTKKILDLIEK